MSKFDNETILYMIDSIKNHIIKKSKPEIYDADDKTPTGKAPKRGVPSKITLSHTHKHTHSHGLSLSLTTRRDHCKCHLLHDPPTLEERTAKPACINSPFYSPCLYVPDLAIATGSKATRRLTACFAEVWFNVGVRRQ